MSFFLKFAFFLTGVVSAPAEVTVTTTSSKGWTKTESFNNLGLTTASAVSGGGIPAADLTPVWRADGSLQSVSLSINGETHAATFNNDGTLASLTAPGRGNILGGHSISNGVETLEVDGVTTTRKLDGTQTGVTGADVSNKTDTIAVDGSGFKHTTTPAVGAATNTMLNAAGALTAKNYAAGNGEQYTYSAGGLLSGTTLARGGSIAFGYSNDGAKDLISTAWPAASSGDFSFPAESQSYGYDRAGRIKEIGDASGTRAIAYANGRVSETSWNSGALAGYKIVTSHDASGRGTGFGLYRGNVLIHSASKALNGDSGEVSALASGDLKVVVGRNNTHQITGFQWGNAAGTFVPVVSQSWTRGSTGRILTASSDVSGALSFNYKGTANNEATAFDSKGRRLRCATAGGEWTYTYTNGQLTSAVHPALGTFTYQFDGIGRRTENSSNTTDLLNRTLTWTNSQSKTLKIVAHPDARVWYNGNEISGFSGSHDVAITSPGTSGGWVAWNTLAVLEGEGDTGANADAKAEQSGAVWVPPVSESFTYDAAGNRQSSALWDFGWDARNNLHRARTKNYNTASQGYDITFDSDAEGRRFRKAVSRYQNGTITEQKIITFIHDGDDLIYEREQLPSGLTTLERKYVWGPDISGTHGGAGGLLLISETKGNTTIDLYPLYDGTGHVVALTDITGTLQAEYAYGPFGEQIYARGPHAESCPFRYATKYFDSETGLYYFGRRYLDPITSQWTSREPLGERESLNLYTYGHSDPINNVDRLGLEAVAVDAAINNGIPTMIYEEWAGSGLAYLWNALAAGKVKTWGQCPNAGELDRCFYFEDGCWHLRSAEARTNIHNAQAVAGIDEKAEEIKRVMDTLHAGGSAVAVLPFAVVAGNSALAWTLASPTTAIGYAEGVILTGGALKGYEGVPTLTSVASKVSNSVHTLEEAAPLVDDFAKAATAATNRLATGPNEAVFWSGIEGSDGAAASWVAKNGGATLETLLKPRGITLPKWDNSNPAVVAAWRQASLEFSQGASGNVRVLQPSDAMRFSTVPGEGSVWSEVEWGALRMNPNVQSITGIIPEIGKEVLLWTR